MRFGSFWSAFEKLRGLELLLDSGSTLPSQLPERLSITALSPRLGSRVGLAGIKACCSWSSAWAAGVMIWTCNVGVCMACTVRHDYPPTPPPEQGLHAYPMQAWPSMQLASDRTEIAAFPFAGLFPPSALALLGCAEPALRRGVWWEGGGASGAHQRDPLT